MPHLIDTLTDRPVSDAIAQLTEAHQLIADALISAYQRITLEPASIGGDFKRLFVALPVHSLIGKDKERFVELVNILATVEKTMDALIWMEKAFENPWLAVCHPSTSDSEEGNDIVLLDKKAGEIISRCEVTDVISSNAGQNGKEKKDLKSLGCALTVPCDGIRRFIATSPEFAEALCSNKRKWTQRHYRYMPHQFEEGHRTVILEILTGV